MGKTEGAVQKVDKQSRVKCQAAGRQDQFGGAVLEARAGRSATPGDRGTHFTNDELEGCLDILATAETTRENNVG